MTKADQQATLYQRPNNQWQCGRVESCIHGPSGDGKCSLANQACVPQRTLKNKKRLVFIWVLCAAIACITVFLSSSNLLTRLSPGPLSLSHAEVASCQDCHAGASQSVGDWVKTALTFDGHNDDQQCLTCHALGENAFAAHSTDAGNFSKQDDQQSFASPTHWKTALAGEFRAWENPEGEDISCSTCHREHKGELDAVANFDPQQCHTCHEKKFDLIETGHPEYSNFPHDAPSRLKFDHAAHLEKHFYEDDVLELAPEGCTTCHATDQTGEWMLNTSFESACSSCHLDDVLGSNRATAKGIGVLAIPELDLDSLNSAGLNIGHWPSWADGDVPPIMQALLLRQVNQPAIVDTALSNNLTLYDLSLASDDQLIAVATLAWEIKRLFYDLQMGGTKIMEQRLSETFGSRLDKSTLNRLIASLPRDTLVNNQQQWFPNLVEEMKLYRQGKIALRSPVSPGSAEAQKTTKSQTGDVQQDESDNEILSEDDYILSEDDDILSEDDDILSEDDDILSEDDDILSEDDSLIKAEDISNDVEIKSADNEAWAVSGGWYRDGSTIRYRPADHGDLFFKTWLEVSAEHYDKIGKALFESMGSKQSVGNCTKCHSIEGDLSLSGAAITLHWQGFKPKDESVDFNRFSHVSHFSLMTDDGCASCHVLSDEHQESAESDSQVLGSGFDNIDRVTCTQCHQRGRAPDNCLTCHNYHAEPHKRSIDKMLDSLLNQVGGAGDE